MIVIFLRFSLLFFIIQICIRLGILDAYNETDDSLTFDDEMKNTILEEFNKWKETHQRFETGLAI
jgi:hypothetical protein